MANSKHIEWLYSQLPELIQKGILSEDAAAKIQGHFGEPSAGQSRNIALIITGILGAILIGAGIILIFAVNWDDFSKMQRTILSFAPMIVAQIIYGYAFLKRKNSTAWTESTAAFLMLMLASSMALISQTYNIGGTLTDFAFTWMLLSIPLMYLTNATLPTLFYLVGTAMWAVGNQAERGEGFTVFYWAFLLAVIPHLVMNISPTKSTTRGTLLGWFSVICISIGTAATLETDIEEQYFLALAIVPFVFYILGKHLFSAGESIWKRPYQTLAIASVVLISLIFAYRNHRLNLDPSKIFSGDDYPAWATTINLLVLSISFIGAVVLAVRRLMAKQPLNFFMLGFPFLILLLLVAGGSSSVLVILFNVFVLGFGIHYIQQGLQYNKLSLVNAGMAFISMLIAMRFFDASISFMVKGIVFILIGVCFLITNFVLSKKMTDHDR